MQYIVSSYRVLMMYTNNFRANKSRILVIKYATNTCAHFVINTSVLNYVHYTCANIITILSAIMSQLLVHYYVTITHVSKYSHFILVQISHYTCSNMPLYLARICVIILSANMSLSLRCTITVTILYCKIWILL